jgi:plastocyanin
MVSVLLLAGAGAAGYTLARSEPRLRAQPEATEAAAEADNVRISEGATIRWEYEYEMCAHTVVVEAPVDDGMARLTFTQLQQSYPDARIVSFDTNLVVLRQRFTCYCPDHYLLKKHEDELAIFRTKTGTDEQRVYRLVRIRFDSIEEGERAVLTIGRVFDSVADADAYLEKIAEKNNSQ